MRKTVLAAVIILLITSSYCLARHSHRNTNFRDTRWGMSKSDVMRTERHRPKYNKGKYLLYKGTVAGLDCDIAYIFTRNRLVRAKYLINESHTNKNLYIDDFKDLKKLLIKKYGAPDKDEILWRNDLFKNDPQSWGTAISVGHVFYFAVWETPKTTIVMLLEGDNYEIQLGIEYSSVELKDLELERRDRKTLDKL